MTPDQFRRLALSCADTEERAHQGHPDFRVQGRVFATLGYPRLGWGMVKLTPEQQEVFLHDRPGVFSPAAGAWGRQGCTLVCLPKARKEILQNAIQAAWQNARASVTRRPASKARRA